VRRVFNLNGAYPPARKEPRALAGISTKRDDVAETTPRPLVSKVCPRSSRVRTPSMEPTLMCSASDNVVQFGAIRGNQ
jgi:hypothetical protein